jgi:hypothetical protein
MLSDIQLGSLQNIGSHTVKRKMSQGAGNHRERGERREKNGIGKCRRKIKECKMKMRG